MHFLLLLLFTLTVDEGPIIDPNGGASASSDRGAGLDPNG